MFIYLIQLASVSMYSRHTDHRFHGWLNLPSRPNSTDNSPARYGLCNPLRLSCVLGATPERIGFEIFEDQCSNWHNLFLTQMSPFFVTLLYGDASFGRAGDDDDDQHNKTFLYLYLLTPHVWTAFIQPPRLLLFSLITNHNLGETCRFPLVRWGNICKLFHRHRLYYTNMRQKVGHLCLQLFTQGLS